MVLSVTPEYRRRTRLEAEKAVQNAAHNGLPNHGAVNQFWKTEKGIKAINHICDLDAKAVGGFPSPSLNSSIILLGFTVVNTRC